MPDHSQLAAILRLEVAEELGRAERYHLEQAEGLQRSEPGEAEVHKARAEELRICVVAVENIVNRVLNTRETANA